MIRNIAIITWRELVAYLTQPVAYVFIIAFTVLAAGLTFYAGGFLDRGSAELSVFFQFHPWLYLVLMPAIGCGIDNLTADHHTATRATPGTNQAYRGVQWDPIEIR